MRLLRRLTSLTKEERQLLPHAWFVVFVTRIALCVVPVAAARRVVAAAVMKTRRAPLERVVWAVKAASRWVPRANCLTQAIAVQTLLSNAGYESRLDIGVSKGDSRGFEAHAWVSHRDRIVIGGAEAARYTRLGSFER